MQGRIVAITGAAKGIGLAAAEAFRAAGATVVALSRKDCDVADWDSVRGAVDRILRDHGRLDVWINNAGVIDPMARLEDADPDAWRRAIDVNLTGVFHGMRAALPVISRQGAILTVSSGAAHAPLEGWSAYCAGKAGAAMLTRAAHLENPDLRIMGLSPGTVATDMQRAIKAGGIDNRVSRLEFSDHIPPEWPARALVWMCGGDAADLNGTEISLRDPAIRARIGI
ncbi:SDR family NAD(P)-dependent oxidoreductase [Cereibacter sp. SYSU M97828]|nr:SDR family NAD(P)-dependent oxidoreductase [Cereibacter flavus]